MELKANKNYIWVYNFLSPMVYERIMVSSIFRFVGFCSKSYNISHYKNSYLGHSSYVFSQNHGENRLIFVFRVTSKL